jgi:hypothetical protein
MDPSWIPKRRVLSTPIGLGTLVLRASTRSGHSCERLLVMWNSVYHLDLGTGSRSSGFKMRGSSEGIDGTAKPRGLLSLPLLEQVDRVNGDSSSDLTNAALTFHSLVLLFISHFLLTARLPGLPTSTTHLPFSYFFLMLPTNRPQSTEADINPQKAHPQKSVV